MPFIDVKTTKKLADSEILAIKAELGEMISLFPGKSESWLMCCVSGGQNMFFKGSDEDCVFAEVKIFGGIDSSSAEKFTAAFCKLFAKYGVSPSRAYVRYEGGTDWGWNGGNF